MSERKYHSICGGHLVTKDPPLGWLTFAATIPTHTFVPGVHLSDADTVLPIRDGLLKLKAFPVEFGGFGHAIAE
jgi:hypothetical protein